MTMSPRNIRRVLLSNAEFARTRLAPKDTTDAGASQSTTENWALTVPRDGASVVPHERRAGEWPFAGARRGRVFRLPKRGMTDGCEGAQEGVREGRRLPRRDDRSPDEAHRHTGARARQRRRGGDEEGRVLQGLAREREDLRHDRPVRLARPDRSLRREAEPRRPHEGKIVGPARLGHGAPRHRPARAISTSGRATRTRSRSRGARSTAAASRTTSTGSSRRSSRRRRSASSASSRRTTSASSSSPTRRRGASTASSSSSRSTAISSRRTTSSSSPTPARRTAR